MKLNNEILKNIKKDTSNGFLYYGKIHENDVYQIIRTHGGKQGLPHFFAINKQGTLEWIKGIENINIIRHFNPKPQLVSPELSYQDL